MVSNTNNGKNNDTNTKFIRLRFSFTGRAYNNTKKGYLKEILHETIQCAKEIDPKIGVMTWSEESLLGTINGDEVKLLSDEMVKEYANFPKIVGDYNKWY